MVFLLLVSELFSRRTPYLLLIDGLAGYKLKWRKLAHHQLLSQQGLILVHTEKLKEPIAKKLVSSDISHVAHASVVLGENPSEEVDDYDNYYYITEKTFTSK